MSALGRMGIVGFVVAGLACADVPEEDALRVEGDLERAAPLDDNAKVGVKYASKNARGEWWPCDLRLTATACVGDFHVNVYVSPPNVSDFEGVGQTACADEGENAFGAFEILKEKLDDGEKPQIPNDIAVLVLVASDADEDGAASLESDDETKAASVLGDGEIEIVSMGSFDDPISLKIDGETSEGHKVAIEVDGPTNPVTEVPTLEVARTCVDGDKID